MGFTVAHGNGGAKDAEFQAYVRLLRQEGKDLGRLPRIPEPGTRRRWLYVWSDHDAAQEFANELRGRTGDPAWEVVPVASPPSEGPLGPLLIQLARRGDGILVAVHPLSLAMIRSVFPEAKQKRPTVFINADQWSDFLKTQQTLEDFIRDVAPEMTGLTPDRLGELGYAVIDADSDETLVFVKPAELAKG